MRGQAGPWITSRIDGVRVHRFSIPRWRWLPPSVHAKLDRLVFFPLLALPIVRKLLRNRRPTFLYAYEASAILSAALARAFTRRRYFLVHRIQGVSVLGDAHRRLWFMIRKLESLLSLKLRADAYIMTNDGTRGDEVWRFWNPDVGADNLLHVRNGIGGKLTEDAGGRDPALAAFGLDPSLTYILMLSRLDPIKRVDRGLKAMAALRHLHPQVRLLIAGDGEDRAPLEQMAAELGIGHVVHFLGAVERDAVVPLMQGADIFLSLYDFSNCGNPLFEALRSGLPVVTLDNGATGTVVTHGVNGLLLPVDDGERLVSALEMLINSPVERQRLRKGAREWADGNLVSWISRMDREVKWLEDKVAR
jgi:glycosyltransferase involved in cell wall biosynthesis